MWGLLSLKHYQVIDFFIDKACFYSGDRSGDNFSRRLGMCGNDNHRSGRGEDRYNLLSSCKSTMTRAATMALWLE